MGAADRGLPMSWIIWGWDSHCRHSFWASSPHMPRPVPPYALSCLCCGEVPQAGALLDPPDIRPEPHLMFEHKQGLGIVICLEGFSKTGSSLSLLYSSILHKQWRVGGAKRPSLIRERTKGKKSAAQAGQQRFSNVGLTKITWDTGYKCRPQALPWERLIQRPWARISVSLNGLSQGRHMMHGSWEMLV